MKLSIYGTIDTKKKVIEWATLNKKDRIRGLTKVNLEDIQINKGVF